MKKKIISIIGCKQRCFVFFAIISAGFPLDAQTINLRGTVSNAEGKPIANAIVTLVRKGLTDTTGSDGIYKIANSTSVKVPLLHPQFQDIVLNKRYLQFRLPNPSTVKINVFDLQGSLLKKEVYHCTTPGCYRFDVEKNRNTTKPLIIKTTIGNSEFTFRYISNFHTSRISSGQNFATSGRKLSNIEVAGDTLRVIALNYVSKTIAITTCDQELNITLDTVPSETMYFPPLTGSEWETKPLSSLGWNESAVQPLKDYLSEKHTKSFMILVNGRIVMEEYMNEHTASDFWEWNSAGKTLVSSTVGIAQQDSLLNINNKVSQYLGTGWTREPLDKEDLITSRHLLTMTSGINDENELVVKANLTYLADAGTRWSYHNVFQKLMDVVAAASNQDFETYFNSKLKNKIGMDGFWNYGIIFKIYHSNTRSMARFGILALNKGKWNSESVLNENFFNECISTSQNMNPSYGYLWWLNGKTSYMVPGGQTVYQGTLVSNAPADMYAAMGAKDQRIYVIPSRKMVIIRMGDASDPANPNFAVSGFDNALWEKINAVIN